MHAAANTIIFLSFASILYSWVLTNSWLKYYMGLNRAFWDLEFMLKKSELLSFPCSPSHSWPKKNIFRISLLHTGIIFDKSTHLYSTANDENWLKDTDIIYVWSCLKSCYYRWTNRIIQATSSYIQIDTKRMKICSRWNIILRFWIFFFFFGISSFHYVPVMEASFLLVDPFWFPLSLVHYPSLTVI